MADDEPADAWIAEAAVPLPYESSQESTAPQDAFRTSPDRRPGAHRAAPKRPRSRRRYRPVRPAIALLAASLVVLLFGTIAAARVIMGPAGSREPATSSGDATPLSEPSDQPAAMSPGATPPPGATTTAAATQGRHPAIEKRLITETRAIAFDTRTVRDNTLAKGTSVVRTRGVPGVRTLTYEVTLANGVQTAKKLVRSVVTKDPVTQVVAIGTRPGPRRHRYPRVTARRRRRQDRSRGETAAPDA